jgi:hypothetical protein
MQQNPTHGRIKTELIRDLRLLDQLSHDATAGIRLQVCATEVAHLLRRLRAAETALREALEREGWLDQRIGAAAPRYHADPSRRSSSAIRRPWSATNGG